MTIYSSITFLVAMFFLAASPGPGVLAVTSYSAKHGYSKTSPMIAGIVTGDILYAGAACAGLSYIAENFHTIFLTIKYLGGAYIIWLGLKSFFSSSRVESVHAPKNKKAFLAGFFITMANPKVILFYTGFLPAFIDLKNVTAYDFFVISCIITSVLFGVLSLYALVTDKLSGKFTGNKLLTGKLSGLSMAAAGSWVILKE